jgi:hypothetical protein
VRPQRLSFLLVAEDPDEFLVEAIRAEGFGGRRRAVHVFGFASSTATAASMRLTPVRFRGRTATPSRPYRPGLRRHRRGRAGGWHPFAVGVSGGEKGQYCGQPVPGCSDSLAYPSGVGGTRGLVTFFPPGCSCHQRAASDSVQRLAQSHAARA